LLEQSPEVLEVGGPEPEALLMPSSIASRKVNATPSRTPQSRGVVTPDSSERRAFAAARSSKSPSGRPTTAWWAGVPSSGRTRWTWQSISPGRSVPFGKSSSRADLTLLVVTVALFARS
jgi:hypothetical protein